jgi:hypothetical protein
MLGRPSPLSALLCAALVFAATISACGSGGASSTEPGGDGGASSDGSTTGDGTAGDSGGASDTGAGGHDATSGSDGGQDAGSMLDGSGSDAASTPDSGTDSGTMMTGADGGDGGGSCVTGFDVQPSMMQTITVGIGQMTPTVTFTATENCVPVSAAWSVDKGNIGTVPTAPATSAVLTPTGSTGGVVTVTASLNGHTISRPVFVKLTGTQNGPNSSPGEQNQVPVGPGALTVGGGVGGVGGEGLGGPVTDMPTLMGLANPTGNGSAQGLSLLYPYDKTVWPRGIPAPLLQWTWAPPGGPAAPGDADAIEIDLQTTTGSFSWSGTFGKPAIVTMLGGKFIRMPIPQDVWAMATNTAGGSADQLTMSLTVAKNGVGYGPISETWTIAPGLLDGTIYYNSYGTELSQNYASDLEGKLFGGAVLSIQVGDSSPKLVAGGTLTQPETNPMSTAGDPCRVCHSVSASGSMLVVQHDSNRSWGEAFALSPGGNTLTDMSDPGGVPVADSTYSGIYPDGTFTLTRSGQLLTLPGGTISPVPPTGLPANPYMPAFSPDGTLVAFNSNVGPQLTVMGFNNATHAFSNSVTVANDTGTSLIPAWPSFFPDSKSVVFHPQSNAGMDGAGAEPCTRGGALAQVAWTNLTGSSAVTPLDNLNGKGYLPKLAAASTLTCTADGIQVGGLDNTHADDVDHNYEPTVLPLGAGGYAWVVFTSRRMYGSVATIPPFCSDPRGVNLEANTANPLATNVTPKKLWVAAVDLTQAPGTDSSHPAFYLPGQELLAGNSRAFWVMSPCEQNGASCTSGDQCCGGYCEPGDGGALVCGMPPTNTCSPVGDKCTTAADCCDAADICLNGFCAIP